MGFLDRVNTIWNWTDLRIIKTGVARLGRHRFGSVGEGK